MGTFALSGANGRQLFLRRPESNCGGNRKSYKMRGIESVHIGQFAIAISSWND